METIKTNISISHNDLDGLGCQLLLRWQYDDIYFRTVSYTNIHNILLELKELLEWDRNKKNVIISDMSLKYNEVVLFKEICNNNPDVKFIYVDHHIRSQDISKLYSEFPSNFIDLYDTTKSSSHILYYYLNINNKRLRDLVELINLYDMWEINDEKFEDSLVLNELYNSVGHHTFLTSISYYGSMSEVLTKKQEKVKKKIQSFINNVSTNDTIFYNDNVCVAYVDRYKSILQYSLNKPISIMISSNLNFSIRLSNTLKDVEVNKYIELFFEFFKDNKINYYHAHRQVFGFNSNGYEIFDDIDRFIDFLDKKIN